MISGLTLTAVFGGLWLVSGQFFWAFPMVFVGVLPGVQGLTRVLNERSELRRLKKEAPRITAAQREKEILRAAQQSGGRITPALAALRTSCSVDEAEQILQELAGKGYASAEVLDTGRLEYQFPEFMDQSGLPPV